MKTELEFENGKIKKKYTESLFYEIFLTGKYIKKMGEQLFKLLDIVVTSEEFSTIDFLYKSTNICQRDLAVKMLINRGNMGKILDSLEDKGIITRTLLTKGKRPVKIVNLTEKGEEFYIATVAKLRQQGEHALSEITEEESETMICGLHKIRRILNKILELDI